MSARVVRTTVGEDGYLDTTATWDPGDPVVIVDADRWQTVLATLRESMYAGGGHGHWDSQMTHGRNCPLCIARQEFNDKARALLAEIDKGGT